MAEEAVCILQQQTEPIKILKWKVREGMTVSVGQLLLLFNILGDQKLQQRRLKSTQAGTIWKILAKEGDVVNPGEGLLQLIACSHPTIMNDMCAECGADLRKEDIVGSASVPMIHAIPDLKVCEETARKLGQADNERLIRDRKLVLLVDLDQTLIHTTNDNIPPNIKDVYHFQLYGPNSPWYHTRLRPATHKFLKNIHDFYELHICTFGARNYAHKIALFLDSDEKLFSNRILSRDECFDPTSKKANLKALFPCGDNMVCIIDDREDVWSHAANLIHVKPYHFFQHTGDINAPPGLAKHDNDKEGGVDLTKIRGKVIKKKVDIVQTDDGDQKIVNKEENSDISQENGQEEKSGGKLPNLEKSDVEENGESSKSTKDTSEGSKEQNEKNIIDTSMEQTVNGNSQKKNDEKVGDNICENLLQENDESIENKKKEINDKPDDEKVKDDEANKKNSQNENEKKDDNLIEIEDPDDYLIFLEEILKNIHKEFYNEYDSLQSGVIPDLKKVIPRVRCNVLLDCRLAFSGLVPTHMKLEQSKAYQVARSLGATVTQDIDDKTTHLVAVRPGTAKVNAGRRKKNLKIVTPDWLWCCAERWEHVDEKIFPLHGKGSKNRHPPPHCSSPTHVTVYPEHETPALGKRTPSGRFMDTINPLMTFSSDDIADMDKEVEDILDDDSESSDDDSAKPNSHFQELAELMRMNVSSSDSENSLTGDYPKGFKRKRDEYNENESEAESVSTQNRRGDTTENELDLEQDDTRDSMNPTDEAEDGEWYKMGAALEREFLSEY